MLSYQALPCSSSPSLSSPCSLLQVTRNLWPWQRSTMTLWQPCDASLCRIAAPIYDRMLGLQIPAVCRVKNEWWTPAIYTFRPLYKYFRQLLLQITTGVSYKALLTPDPICPSSQGCWIDGLAFTYHSNPILTCNRVAEWDMFRMGDNYQRGMQSRWMELGIGGLMYGMLCETLSRDHWWSNNTQPCSPHSWFVWEGEHHLCVVIFTPGIMSQMVLSSQLKFLCSGKMNWMLMCVTSFKYPS